MDGNKVDTTAAYDAETRSMKVKVSANTTSEIRLLIQGERLVTDNGDVANRCSKLLQRMAVDNALKGQVMGIVRDTEMPLERKIRNLNFKCANSMEHQDLIEAMKEQLTLVEER